MSNPPLSIVVPTSGKERNLSRCLDSLIFSAPIELLSSAELIVFLNEDPASPIQYAIIDAYIERVRGFFASVKTVRAEKFELTAEESAFAATRHATGDYIWLVGDKRIFYPEGLRVLHQWMLQPTAPAAYFNSGWIDQNGLSESITSSHFMSNRSIMPYNLFVMSTGINYMATNMGSWVFERRIFNMDIWRHLIDKCGPHFSHVALALATLRDENVQCFAEYLCQLESKAYHQGDDREWVRYSKLSKTYRFYAWTLGMVRQYEYLVREGALTYGDIRRSMCSQGLTIRRQVDEIYMHLLGQLRYGWYENAEKFTQSEFDEMYQFLRRVCPEKIVLNEMIRDIYSGCGVVPDKPYSVMIDTAYTALGLDFRASKFGSLIVGQVGDNFIRLHPKGFVMSKVRDNKNFILAYKFSDAPVEASDWSILSQSELDQVRESEMAKVGSKILRLKDIYPVAEPSKRTPIGRIIRKVTGAWIVSFYRRRSTYQFVAKLPPTLKRRLKSLLM